MNTTEKFLLRLSILIRRKLGYRIPQLNEARPIRTGRFNIYRHHGRLVRLEPMTAEELEEVNKEQARLDNEWLQRKAEALQAWIDLHASKPSEAEVDKFEFSYEQQNERPEYRPCSMCTFSAETPGDVLPCPYYNIVADSARHACCTHKYVIIKDIERL